MHNNMFSAEKCVYCIIFVHLRGNNIETFDYITGYGSNRLKYASIIVPFVVVDVVFRNMNKNSRN